MGDNKQMPVLKIREEKIENLSISEDIGFEDEPIAVLLFTPNTEKFDHWHIELDVDQCVKMREWLDEFICRKTG